MLKSMRASVKKSSATAGGGSTFAAFPAVTLRRFLGGSVSVFERVMDGRARPSRKATRVSGACSA